MCEFCTKHGEGKAWYLNANNYSNDLLNDARRRKFVTKHFYWIDDAYKNYYGLLKSMPLHIPLVRKTIMAIVKKIYLYKHWGQVIPIEDVEKILDITNSVTRIPCGCRMATTKKENRVCFLVSFDPRKLGLADIVDKSYFGGPDTAKFEQVTKEWTLDFMRDGETRGMIHTVWAFEAPFVGGICNCDIASGCVPMMMYKNAVPVMFRSEYVAIVDEDRCIGCKKCIEVCQFSAIREESKDKVAVDVGRCYGCGICRVVCGKKALSLVDRAKQKNVSDLWY